MSPKLSHFGLALVLNLITAGTVMAQAERERPVKPTGPAAKKADDLIRAYTVRIEKEIAQGRKEVERLRAELHELIDVRDAMADAIAELRGELATKGTYSANPVVNAPAAPKTANAPASGTPIRRDFVYGLGTSLSTEPTPQQLEQLRRLAPRADVKRMIERLRLEVDETRAEVDQLAYNLLELGSGVTDSFQPIGGGLTGGMVAPYSRWFDTIGEPRYPMGGMGGGMR
jgi:hypothetical protein